MFAAMDARRRKWGAVKRLRDAETRKTIWDEMKAAPRYWNDVTISSVATAANEPLVGKTVAEIAGLRGVDPENCAMDILVEEDAAVNIVSFNQSEENLRQLITHPLCSVITDGFYVRGKAHPRLVWDLSGTAGQTRARAQAGFR